MKLNYKRTLLVGFAFFLILAFWQAYDTIVPKILTDKFGLSQTWSGAIMALDNVFALFLLPLFGAISDKSRSKYGRRTPFIVIGTILSAALLITLAFTDRAQLKQLEAVQGTEGTAYTEALETIWDANPNVSVDDDESVLAMTKPLQETITREEFLSIPFTVTDENGEKITNPAYTNIVVLARQAYAAKVTAANPLPLVLFMIVLFLCVPGLAGSVGVLVPVGVLIALGAGRLMYKKGWL